MKLVFLIADGMGDWPIDSLGGRTPLEAAPTPAMDELSRRAVLGLARTVPEGMAPGSDVANMALMGFDPAAFHTGRGPIEAAAQGLTLGADDVVWRMNLVTVSALAPGGIMRDYSSGHIATEAATALIRDLAETLRPEGFRLVPGIQYRHLLIEPGATGKPGRDILVRPPHDITDQVIDEDLAAFKRHPALERLVKDAAARLAANPENRTKASAVWPWGQGRRLSLPDFRETFGLKGAVISAVDLVRGLGRAAGMEVIEVPGVTGLLDTNYEGKVAAALDFLERGDFVFVHLEGPDECGHGGHTADKIEAIARFDARVVAPMVAGLTGIEAAVVVTCDHLTPIAIRTHHPDPVPFLLSWPGAPETPGRTGFSEAEAARAGLVVEPGHSLLPWMLKTIGRR